MTDSTQLADQYLLQSSLKPDVSVKVSRGKGVAVVNDGQTGSYSSGIVSFDCQSALNGSHGYASLKDAYVVLPYVVSMKNSAASALTAGDCPTRYALGLKCNIYNIVDEVKVYLNGKSIITPSEYKQQWSNFRAMAELTTAEVEKHGADMFLFPDDWESIKHSAASSISGDGNSNTCLSGNSSLVLNSVSNTEPTRSNSGFVRRVLNNPPEVGSGAAANSHGWPSLNKSTSQAIAQMRGTGAFKKGTALTQGSTLGEWLYMLKIRLVDLHSIFNELDLLGNPQLKLELKVQTGYSEIALTPRATVASRTMALTSTTLIAGTVCPVILGSSVSPAGTADAMNAVIGDAGKSDKLQIAWGSIHNTITTIATSGSYFPFTQGRLNIPFYDLANPTALVSKPMKTIKYLDCYSQLFSVQFNSMRHTNWRFPLVAIPYANTKTSNFASAHQTQQFASLFDSVPWTCQPGSSIRDFQVQVGIKNVFQDVHLYDWQAFMDEFSKIGAINGDLSREISNGLIGIDKWQTAQRFLVADCSRISEPDVPQSINVSGVNVATQGSNLLVLVVYERTLEIDRITGEVFRAD
ncbi:hypothetical protein PHYSODRAFT_530771 [Phytophthora sojae]|uniref:Uncharacterized protein n=1 Tax=Phytophthora sojae (strain P6497) TaxID=1094619 RepID=G5ACT3_PHYSP|nr:hypothetical protein PHYSODRAFT_530771 [Phytophthora sojae]EGZ07157.1 hypothetical protein PHYSODRAFT_530771 [Phytophthora sojae]|eukprot:XP_009537921.1 hypothetical protein PHYSODRAFT_530771 [Phytophthora sojae]